MPDGVGLPFTANDSLSLPGALPQRDGQVALAAYVSVHLSTQTPRGGGERRPSCSSTIPSSTCPRVRRPWRRTRCPIPQNITLFTEGSHYHARGVGYQAYLDPPSGSPAKHALLHVEQLGQPDYCPSIPSTCRPARTFATTATTTTRRARRPTSKARAPRKNEMCMFIGMYYPAMSTADEQCYSWFITTMRPPGRMTRTGLAQDPGRVGDDAHDVGGQGDVELAVGKVHRAGVHHLQALDLPEALARDALAGDVQHRGADVDAGDAQVGGQQLEFEAGADADHQHRAVFRPPPQLRRATPPAAQDETAGRRSGRRTAPIGCRRLRCAFARAPWPRSIGA